MCRYAEAKAALPGAAGARSPPALAIPRRHPPPRLQEPLSLVRGEGRAPYPAGAEPLSPPRVTRRAEASRPASVLPWAPARRLRAPRAQRPDAGSGGGPAPRKAQSAPRREAPPPEAASGGRESAGVEGSGCARCEGRVPAAARSAAGPWPERPAAMPAFRQVGEKQLPQEVVFMAWSPKRDLIALANRAGEVSAGAAAEDTSG